MRRDVMNIVETTSVEGDQGLVLQGETGGESGDPAIENAVGTGETDRNSSPTPDLKDPDPSDPGPAPNK
jgi:hypothetical protein